MSAFINLKPPNTLKKVRSFLRSVHHFIRFIPNLAKLCRPLRPLLEIITEKYTWTNDQNILFEKVKNQIAQATKNKHHNPRLEIRVKCDASREGFEAALEQLDTKAGKQWHSLRNFYIWSNPDIVSRSSNFGEWYMLSISSNTTYLDKNLHSLHIIGHYSLS